jgi:hypothetical protein
MYLQGSLSLVGQSKKIIHKLDSIYGKISQNTYIHIDFNTIPFRNHVEEEKIWM